MDIENFAKNMKREFGLPFINVRVDCFITDKGHVKLIIGNRDVEFNVQGEVVGAGTLIPCRYCGREAYKD